MHFKTRVDDVKRGVLQAGGFPIELPALSLSKSLLADHHALSQPAGDGRRGALRGHPVDGVVLMGGCDEDHAGALLGAISVGLRRRLPAGRADAARQLEGQGAGFGLGRVEISGTSAAPARSPTWTGSTSRPASRGSYGTCMTMGTAATMMAMAETLGMALPGAPSIPAADANHIRMASECVGASSTWSGKTPTLNKILTHEANAITVAMAMGCSTNAIIHLIALARRAGQAIGLDDFERASRKVPVIANIRPSGRQIPDGGFLLCRGRLLLIEQIRDHLHLDVLTVTGRTLART